jgi:hypothetical protein
MNTQNEHALRVAAWGWAAVILGQEVTEERLQGLAEITSAAAGVDIRWALERILKTSDSPFLPPPGAVLAKIRGRSPSNVPSAEETNRMLQARRAEYDEEQARLSQGHHEGK